MPAKYSSPAEQITRNIAVTATGCWEWQRRRSDRGYGVTHVGRRTVRAHRLAYEAFVGPIPDGLTIDHLCRNRACVNPEHLEPVTQRVNTLRSPLTPAGANARKTRCAKGHPFNPANTYFTSRGRICKTCQVARTRAWRIRRALRAANVPASAAA